MPYEFRQLQVPTLAIPDLFLAEKIVIPVTNSPNTTTGGSIGPPPGLQGPHGSARASDTNAHTHNILPSSPQLSEAAAKSPPSVERVASSPPGLGLSYRSAALQNSSPVYKPPLRSMDENGSPAKTLRPLGKVLRIDFTIVGNFYTFHLVDSDHRLISSPSTRVSYTFAVHLNTIV